MALVEVVDGADVDLGSSDKGEFKGRERRVVSRPRHEDAVRAKGQDQQHLLRPDRRNLPDAPRTELVEESGEGGGPALPADVRGVEADEQWQEMEGGGAARLERNGGKWDENGMEMNRKWNVEAPHV